jgi:hypothetical protein
MAWANNTIALHRSTSQDAAVVRADILDRIELAVEIEHRSLRPIEIDDAMRSGGEINGEADGGPIAHVDEQ